MKNQIVNKKIFSIFTITIYVTIFSFGAFIFPRNVTATGSLTSMSDVLSPATGTYNALKASTAANHLITFTTPTGVASGATIILTFDNGTSIHASLDYTDIDLKDDGVDVTLAASPSGGTWGVVRTSSTVITFTNGTTVVAGGSVIAIEIGTNATNGTTGDQQITNGSAGTTLLVITGSFDDTGTIAIPIIADDLVVVNAVVTPTISFTISDNTIYFGNLRSAGACFAQGSDPGAVTCPTTVEAEAFNLTAGTNAASGYTITVLGATLTSGSNTIDPLASNTASSPGTEQFGIRATASGGSGTVSAPFAAAGYAWTATASTPVTLASHTAPSATTTYSIREIANISSNTEAGVYTSNQTYTATGNF